MTQANDLTLYHFNSCPFCVRVRHAAHSLGVQLKLADINQDPQSRQELVGARGRTTVPVLRIENENGDVEWMPESADIVRYLNQRFG